MRVICPAHLILDLIIPANVVNTTYYKAPHFKLP
jgi:hypothetical protein